MARCQAWVVMIPLGQMAMSSFLSIVPFDDIFLSFFLIFVLVAN